VQAPPQDLALAVVQAASRNARPSRLGMDPAGRLGGRSRPHPFGQLSTVTALTSPGFAFLAAWRRAAELAGR